MIFVSPTGDQEATEALSTQFSTLSVTHAKVELSVKTEFMQALQENAALFGYREAELTQVYIEGVSIGSALEVNAMQENGELAQRIPDGCIKESIQ